MGRAAGQVRERVKRGLKEAEGGNDKTKKKREAYRGNASGGEGRVRRRDLGRGGGWEMRGPSNTPV